MHPDKAALRAELLDRRRQLSRGTLLVAAARVREHVVGAVRTAGAQQICGYVPFGAEPGSRILLDALTIGGVEVLLPVLRDDLDLDWAVYTGPRSLVAVERGPAEPMGRRLGCSAVAGVDVAIVPALAVDPAGNRLGRGGGSYDRCLARVPAGIPIVALLHDGELLPAVPAEPHDRAVTHTVTPTRGWEPVGAAAL
ncbi:MAG: 5-formyltetrahydrofolate cyclo-ligase [Actinomycetota bacterium]|nr:5-formyltetrahydrofolate cyclo-ligase [Actinomycetota bacterium]